MKVSKLALQEALEKVKPGLAGKELIEQSTSFCFMGDRVVTYNDEISVSHPVEGIYLTGAVRAKELYEFLGRVKNDEIDLEPNGGQLVITAGRSKAGLVMEAEVRLPIDEEIGEVKEWKNLPDGFTEALAFCYPCCSRDMSRPVFTCVSVGKKEVQATDTYQAVRYELSDVLPVQPFLIPSSSVKELVKYDVKEIAEGGNWIHFRTDDGTIFSSRTVENEFPETSHIFRVEGKEFVFPQGTEEVLRRAEVFSKSEIETEKLPVVRVGIENGKMSFRAKNEYGWFEELIEIEYNGKPVLFSIGIEFLQDMLAKLRQCMIGEGKICFSGDNWKHVIAIMASKGDEE